MLWPQQDGRPPAIASFDAADAELRDKSGIDDKKDDPDTPKPPRAPRQPRLRRPIPPDLRRVPNPIAVPEAERACPECGDERTCIGHEVTEVVDLIPAEVIVRLDSREKLACERCDGELVRAPLGDKVVDGASSAAAWSRSCSSTSTTTGCRCTGRSSASSAWG